MRLIELTVSNFRGFGPSAVPIDLSSDLILVYGPNGHGKTSIAEALEWLFYGTTKRRQRGEEFSKAEYSGTFANVHAKTPAEVSLRVDFNGRETTLSRVLGAKESSTTYVDGSVAEFGSIGLFPVDAHYPVVAQHGLQTFVHSRPKDRRDAICAALGLEDLTSFKSALESAKGSFQRNPPTNVVEARKRIGERGRELTKIRGLDHLAGRWIAGSIATDDQQVLLHAASAITGDAYAQAGDALEALRAQREDASRSVFGLAIVAPVADRTQLARDAGDRVNDLEKAAAAVDDGLGRLIAGAVSTYSASLLAFWSAGLELDSAGDICPMCEELTLTHDHRVSLVQRLDDAKEVLAANTELSTSIAAWEPMVAVTGRAIAAMAPKGLDDQARAQFVSLLGQCPELHRFLAVHDAFVAARRDFGAV